MERAVEVNVNLSPNAATPAPPADLVKESSDRAFKADVIDASLEAPVLVDFWAPWCGPCRALSPNIEKVVREKAGKIRLVKINTDEHPAIAGQLGVQSIPAVFAFAGGRPVDAFIGNLPESEIRKFADKVIAAGPAQPRPDSVEDEIRTAIAGAREALTAGDLTSAAQIFGMVLQHQPDNVDAILGMARVYLEAKEPVQAQAVLDTLEDPKPANEDYASLVAALKLQSEAAELGAIAELRQMLERNADDHKARYDLALALNAEGKREAAAETLLALLKRERGWNEDAARKKLLDFFEAWGVKDPATIKGRRALSALLFS